MLTSLKPTLNLVRGFICAAILYNDHAKSKLLDRAVSDIRLFGNEDGVYTVESLLSQKVRNSVLVTYEAISFPVLEFL